MQPDTAQKITAKLKAIGFIFVTLDLLGYRTGAMHEMQSKVDSPKS
ncbi:MAG: hypothetical protein ACE14V_07755 [bacterium]